MAVVVEKNKGKIIYKILGTDIASEDYSKADKLDETTEKEITQLIKKLKKINLLDKNTKKNELKTYWYLGKTLSKIADDTDLLNPVERPLYWLNAKMYIPEELLKEDRGVSRIHLEYCYRLGKFSLKKANKLKWGEWVYLFDSPSINSELRFDKWFDKLMDNIEEKFNRKTIRFFVQILNSLLGNIDTEAMKDRELFSCYQAAWLIREKCNNRFGETEIKTYKESIIRSIKNNYAKLSRVMDNKLEPEEFAEIVLNEI